MYRFRVGYAAAIGLVAANCTWSGIPARVVATPEVVQAHAFSCSAPPVDLTPAGYVIAGFDYVDGACDAFFDDVVEIGKSAKYASSAIATANTQAAVILALAAATANATAIATVAASSELARKLIEGYAAEFAFSPYALEVRRLVNDAKTAYRSNATVVGAISALETSPPSGDSYCFAHNIVRNYAKICTVSNIEALGRQAIASAPVVNSAEMSPVADISSRALRPSTRSATRGEINAFRRTFGLPNFVAGSAKN